MLKRLRRIVCYVSIKRCSYRRVIAYVVIVMKMIVIWLHDKNIRADVYAKYDYNVKTLNSEDGVSSFKRKT